MSGESHHAVPATTAAALELLALPDAVALAGGTAVERAARAVASQIEDVAGVRLRRASVSAEG